MFYILFPGWHGLCNRDEHRAADLPDDLTRLSGKQALPPSLRDKTMKTRNFENKLATIGALFVLIGVFSAASSALADSSVNAEQTANAASPVVVERSAAKETISGAREAIAESAAEANKALKAETTFDLENQLSDITSTLIAANK